MTDRLKTALTLSVGTAGLITLIVIEILRAGSATEPDWSGIPPADMLVVIITLSAIPILLITLIEHRASNWISLVIAGLLSVFHTVHTIEHVMSADWSLTLLILVTMLAPSAVGTWLIWGLIRKGKS